jgi:hypothetical protein
MAENNRMKELAVEVKKNADDIQKLYDEVQIQFERFGKVSDVRFQSMEDMKLATDGKLDKITETLSLLLLNNNNNSVSSSHGGPNSNKPPFQVRNIKLDFPRFDGKNVMEWIFRAEQFFDYYGTPDKDRLTITSVHLDQDVVPWFQMIQRTHPFNSWVEFTRALELDFGPSIYDCPRASLFKLAQTGTVNDYYLKFTALANRVYGLSTDAMVDCFVSGLNPEIRRDVMIHTPVTIVKAVSLAKVYEEKYNSTPKPQKTQNTQISYQNRSPFNSNKPENSTKSYSPPLLPTPPTRPMHPNQKNPNIRRISPAEMQLRKEKGQCYWCDDKFSFSHNCPNKHLMLLQSDPTAEIAFDDVLESPEPTSDIITQTETNHHLSLNALKGANSLGTMRFMGRIGKIRVQILIDGGSSDNFMQPRIAHFLKLPVEPAPCFKVLVGNGQIMTAEGVVTNLSVVIQEHEMLLPVYLLPIAGADLILGTAWLATLGPHVADYSALTLKFFHKGKFITLQGDPNIGTGTRLHLEPIMVTMNG